MLRNLRKRRTKSGGGGVSFGAGIINGLRRTNADQKTRSIGAFKEGKLVQHRTMFTPLNFESSDHPFFQRAWIVGHRLDSDSPLLTKAVRHEIAKNHGSWPKQLNNYEGIRGSLRKFDRLLLSINATSDISGCDVSCTLCTAIIVNDLLLYIIFCVCFAYLITSSKLCLVSDVSDLISKEDL